MTSIKWVFEQSPEMGGASGEGFTNPLLGSGMEPAADLAVLLAIHSSMRNKALPRGLVVFGEIGQMPIRAVTPAHVLGILQRESQIRAGMGALQDQIMVDPQLAQKSNADAIRPPSQSATRAASGAPFSTGLPVQLGIAVKRKPATMAPR